MITGICVLMLYPYIGAGILLAILCFEAKQYVLMGISFAVCVALHFTMQKHIRPVRGVVAPSRAGRRRKKKSAQAGSKSQSASSAKSQSAGSKSESDSQSAGSAKNESDSRS